MAKEIRDGRKKCLRCGGKMKLIFESKTWSRWECTEESCKQTFTKIEIEVPDETEEDKTIIGAVKQFRNGRV